MKWDFLSPLFFPEKVYFFSFWVVVNCFWVEVVHLKYFFW